ncbi:MAG TPA: flavodoxin family protein [Methanomassiliicoccales archaeon]|nr:flavodoxin family protein [Methanomassiliicoccales archaeon]
MLVVGLLGSPRRGGNCDLLLDAALAAARDEGAEVEKVELALLDVEFCRACNRCFETGECAQEDDMERVYALLEQADSVILCSPIWFSDLSSPTKTMIDRCQCLWARGEFLGKPLGKGRDRRAALISVAGDENESFRGAVHVARSFFVAVGFRSVGELLFPGVSEKGDILKIHGAIAKAIELGKSLASSPR